LCDQVDAKLLSLVYISIEAMFANKLTKVPPKPKHCYCCHVLGLLAKLLIEGVNKIINNSFFQSRLSLNGSIR
jgi:hypothetical protein